MNAGLTKTFTAGGAIEPRRIVKMGASDGTVLQAGAAADLVFGVCNSAQSRVTNDRVDVQVAGIASVEAGGTIARGAKVMSDSAGKGIAAAASAGANVEVIGVAVVTAASGDFIDVLLAVSTMQGA